MPSFVGDYSGSRTDCQTSNLTGQQECSTVNGTINVSSSGFVSGGNLRGTVDLASGVLMNGEYSSANGTPIRVTGTFSTSRSFALAGETNILSVSFALSKD